MKLLSVISEIRMWYYKETRAEHKGLPTKGSRTIRRLMPLSMYNCNMFRNSQSGFAAHINEN